MYSFHAILAAASIVREKTSRLNMPKHIEIYEASFNVYYDRKQWQRSI
jgi:hypothetical protein